MRLKGTLLVSLLLFVAGGLGFYFWRGLEPGLWFSLGGALALMNVFVAAWSIRFGLENFKKQSLFMGLLLLKSFSFLMIIAIILIFLKPLLLPFTLGISVVIVGATLTAVWEIRRMRRGNSQALGEI